MEEEKFDVVIEVGHKATLKEKVDSNGNTHKWNAFVRSGDQSNNQKLDLIVKKVVFNLHETFKNPLRQCFTQPYCVKESGYGQFEFPIDIYFNGTDTKYSINYYLELPSLDCTQPLSRVRKEIITFINPCPEFRKILIDGGSILHKSGGENNNSNTNKTNLNTHISESKTDQSDFTQDTPKFNISINSSLSTSNSTSSSIYSSSPSSNSPLTPDKKLKNRSASTNNLLLNTSQNQLKANSSLSKPHINTNETYINNKNISSSSNKSSKIKNHNRSKGKSTVIQRTISPQNVRSMSISPSPKETAKSSSPNNDARIKLSPSVKVYSAQVVTPITHNQIRSPSNNHNYLTEFSLNDTTANTTDGSFLEVENEIEIKTEIEPNDDDSLVNLQKNINNKKRPLNSNDSIQSNLSNSSSFASLTGIINNLNGNVKKSTPSDENQSAKKKRFKSQENNLESDLSFNNENKIKKKSIDIQGQNKKLKRKNTENDLKNNSNLLPKIGNKVIENDRSSPNITKLSANNDSINGLNSHNNNSISDRRSVSPYNHSRIDGESTDINPNSFLKMRSFKTINKSQSQSPIAPSDEFLNKPNEVDKYINKSKNNNSCSTNSNGISTKKLNSSNMKESIEKITKKADMSLSSAFKSDSILRKNNENLTLSAEKSEKLNSQKTNDAFKSSDKKYENDRKSTNSHYHDRRSVDNGINKNNVANNCTSGSTTSNNNSSGGANRNYTSHSNLGNLENQSSNSHNGSNSKGSSHSNSHLKNNENEKDTHHHHRSHIKHNHGNSSHDSRRHSSSSNKNHHESSSYYDRDHHRRSNDRDSKDSRFSSSNSSRHNNSNSSSSRKSSDRKSSEKSSLKSERSDTVRRKNSLSSSNSSNRLSANEAVKKEEIIEELNKKLRKDKMDEENMKIDDDNCSHTSTLSTMSTSSTSSSILSNKLNYHNSNEKKNLKYDQNSKIKSSCDSKTCQKNTQNLHSSPSVTKENGYLTRSDEKRTQLNKERMLKLFEKINQIFASKQYDRLAKICTIVMPFGFIDACSFKFDLFSLETNVIEKLEDLLLKEEPSFSSLNQNSESINSDSIKPVNNIPNTTSMSPKNINSLYGKGTNITNYSSVSSSSSSSFANISTNSSTIINKISSKNNSSTIQSNSNNNFTSKTKEIKTNIIK